MPWDPIGSKKQKTTPSSFKFHVIRPKTENIKYLQNPASLESGSMWLFTGKNTLQPRTVFFFHNSIWFLGYGLVIGILLPSTIHKTLMVKLGTETLSEFHKDRNSTAFKREFYASRQNKVLEPRRPAMSLSLKTQPAGWLKKRMKKQHRRLVLALPTIEEIPRTLIYWGAYISMKETILGISRYIKFGVALGGLVFIISLITS